MSNLNFCASGCQSVQLQDGTRGFLDPSDGTYYDSQGNDITGYVQNFGGAKVLGPANPSDIAAAEGLPQTVVRQPAPGVLPPGPSPRVNVPLSMSTAGMYLANNPGIAAMGIVLVAALMMGGGGRRR